MQRFHQRHEPAHRSRCLSPPPQPAFPESSPELSLTRRPSRGFLGSRRAAAFRATNPDRFASCLTASCPLRRILFLFCGNEGRRRRKRRGEIDQGKKTTTKKQQQRKKEKQKRSLCATVSNEGERKRKMWSKDYCTDIKSPLN